MNQPHFMRKMTQAWVPVGVFLAGTLMSSAAAWLLFQEIRTDFQAQFDRMSSRTAIEIESRFSKPVYGLRGTRGLFVANPLVTREQFRAAVNSRNLHQEFPGVRGLGFIERVEIDAVDDFLLRARADQAPDFQIRQLSDRSHKDLYVIKFIEPIANNMAAVGLDIGSEPIRRAGAVLAADTGQPTVTGAITLVQDQKQTPGLLMFVPVYHGGVDLSISSNRRQALLGLVYAPIIMAELMQAVPDVEAGLLNFTVWDSQRGAPKGTLLFDSESREPGSQPPVKTRTQTHLSDQELYLPGRELTLSIASTPQFEASVSYSSSWLMLVGGTLISALLALITRQQAIARRAAEARTQSISQDLNLMAEVVKHTGNAVSTADRAGRITWVNEGFTRITGYSLEEARGKTPAELLGSGKADPEVLRELAQAGREGRSCRVELLNRAKDGREYWTDTEIQPQHDPQGRHIGFMEIGIDVTDRRRTQARLEAAIRENDALLGTMNLHAIISTANREGMITDVNDAFCDISGYDREALIGQDHRIVNSGTHSPEFWADMWKTIATGMPWRGEMCNRAKDGSTFWLDTFIAPFIGDDGQIDKYISIRTDITHSKKAQAEALRSSELLRGSIEAIDEAFVLYDPQDRLVLCNEKYRTTYQEVAHLMVPGARFEDIVRAGALEGQYVDARGRVEEWVAERVRIHQAGQSSLVQRLGNGRSLRIIERKLPDGHIVGFRIDITELVQATEAAQAASQSKSQFLANMSHEIRTPMNAILGMLTLLRKTPLAPKQADYAAKSEGAARSLLGLINEILDFSKIEAGKMTLDVHPFAIDQLLRDLSVLFSASVGAKPVEVLFDVDASLPKHVVGDAMRIQQVLLNLGSNAIKFTATGEVVVSIQLIQRTDEAVTLQFSVRDSGIGIAPENQARIFSGFTQAESSTTRRFGGTGLGVAISQRFVTMMGGELEVQSTLGEGSRFYFTITLPLAEPSPLGPPLIPDATVAALRILVVDDNPMAGVVLQGAAQAIGWSADLATDAPQALAMLRDEVGAKSSYQALFLDWQMPEMDGLAVARAVRLLPQYASTPIILMLTAHGRELFTQQTESEQALVNALVVKPATASMLQEAVTLATSAKERVLDSTPPDGTQHRQRLAQMRLLVVEDNANNQQIARELLEDEGAIVQLASDGREGVEAVAAADPPFDVVLMDLQMPFMDGFSATRWIRQELRQTALPIVAMTANAMASDREACIAAGMNDHVGKPFELNHLVRVLRKQAKWTEAQLEDAPRHQELAKDAIEAAAAAGIEMTSAIQRLGGKLDLYHRMLATFVVDLTSMTHEMERLGANGQVLEAKRLLHTLKGLAATLGVTGLSSQTAQIEKQLTTNTSTASLGQLLAQAREAINAANPGLQSLLNALHTDAGSVGSLAGKAPPTTVDGVASAALSQALLALHTLLKDGSMDAMQSMADLQQEFGDTLGDQLGPLSEAMSELDFDSALTHCAALIESCSA